MATGTKSVFLKVNNTSNERPKNEGCLSPTDQSLFLALFVTPYCPAENAAGSLGNRNGRYMIDADESEDKRKCSSCRMTFMPRQKENEREKKPPLAPRPLEDAPSRSPPLFVLHSV
jgi:hypothetical protein